MEDYIKQPCTHCVPLSQTPGFSVQKFSQNGTVTETVHLSSQGAWTVIGWSLPSFQWVGRRTLKALSSVNEESFRYNSYKWTRACSKSLWSLRHYGLIYSFIITGISPKFTPVMRHGKKMKATNATPSSPALCLRLPIKGLKKISILDSWAWAGLRASQGCWEVAVYLVGCERLKMTD